MSKKKSKANISKRINIENPPVKGRPRIYRDDEADRFAQTIEEYFEACDRLGRKYTFSGLALCLGMSVRTLRDYKKEDAFSPSINRARLRIQDQYEQELFRSQGSTQGVQFALKNNFEDYKDETVIQNNISGSITVEEFLKDSGSEL